MKPTIQPLHKEPKQITPSHLVEQTEQWPLKAPCRGVRGGTHLPGPV